MQGLLPECSAPSVLLHRGGSGLCLGTRYGSFQDLLNFDVGVGEVVSIDESRERIFLLYGGWLACLPHFGGGRCNVRLSEREWLWVTNKG